MLDEDGSLDPTLKAILLGILFLALAKILWTWITVDVPHWFNTTVWPWINGHPWWCGLIAAALLLLVGLTLRWWYAGGYLDSLPEEYEYDRPQEADTLPYRLTYRMRQMELMSPTAFEHMCADLLIRDGFHHARRIGGSGDLGADVEAYDEQGRKLILQCKRYKQRVGSPALQTFNGTARPVHRADFAVVVGLNGFSQPAVDFAASQNIALVGRPELKRWAHGEDLYSVLADQLADHARRT
ncbi:restriction endonuclease [Streptacidiphilus sp. EB103A]|uniref:restriction endonuclease n=1 Tax=Streptacidiphilus sp. EB103A TaxID=3156275 RepID=UPI00351993CE